jgi:hypothetical protein
VGQTNDRPQTTGGKTAKRFNKARFVQYELSADQKATCKAWLLDPESLHDAMFKFCEAGYSFSCKWDGYSKSYAAFGRIDAPKHENFDLILTGRGSSPIKAVKQMLFKHFMVFDMLWAAYAERREDYEFDD